MKKLVIMTTICLAMLLLTSVTKADVEPLTVNVTYRDFTSEHPDFEFQGLTDLPSNFYSGDSAIVGDPLTETAKLGLDGKPVYTGNVGDGTRYSGTKTTSGLDNFKQWYTDTPGVNQALSGQLLFEDIGGGLYQYTSNSFFPIDGQGYGNSGLDENNVSHNFHFTMELNTEFTYKAGTGQTFEFDGDDDLFLYINDYLVIDLGGVHSSQHGEVDLDTIAASIGLVDNGNYAFDLFFAERNTTASNFTATTSILLHENPVVPVPGALLLGLLGFGATGMKLRKFA